MGQDCCKPQTPKNATLHHNLVWEKQQDFHDEYKVVALIGEGSISNIYKITKKQSSIGGSARKELDPEKQSNTGKSQPLGKKSWISKGEIYALKQINLDSVKDGYIDELRNEIDLLKDLDHPNIIKAYETFYYKKTLSIVLELCSGGDLYARHPYSEQQAADIVGQILRAVAYMHGRKVIHRDIKFENIMFVNKDLTNWQVKLIDFGLSTVYKDRLMTDRVGTTYTMSPQVLQGVYSSKADLWSVGVVTFMLVSSEKPFWGPSRKAIIKAVIKGEYSFDGPQWANVSQEGKDFVSSLLQKDPGKRPDAKKALKHPWLSAGTLLSDRKPDQNLLNSAKANIVRYAESGEFKKVVMNVIAKKSTAEDILELRKVFTEFDSDQTGTVSLAEFKKALSQSNLSEKEIQEIFNKLDVNHNNTIMYTEFIASVLEVRGNIEEHLLAGAFDQIDSDNSGYITKENLRKILGSNGSKDYVDRLIKEADLNNDGRISYEEFKQYLAQKNVDDIHLVYSA